MSTCSGTPCPGRFALLATLLASVGLYGRLDLDPSLDQSVKLFNLARKFPSVEKESGSSLGELEASLFKELGLGDMTYDADVKPWFDHKIGFGLWSSRQSTPYLLVTMASSDDGAARTALKKAQDKQTAAKVGYSVDKGWATIAIGDKNAQDAAKEAVEATAQGSLADDGAFSRALGKMPEGQVAIGWANLEHLKQQLTSGAGSEWFDGVDVKELSGDLTGQVLIGAQAASDGIELRMRIGGTKTKPSIPLDVLPSLTSMPANTAVGVAVAPGSAGGSAVDLGGLTKALGTSGTDLVKAVVEAKLVTAILVPGSKAGVPAMKMAVDAQSQAAADLIAKNLQSISGSSQVKVDRNGTKTEVSTTGFPQGSGSLGDQQQYRTAMAGMPSPAAAVLYLNVSSLFDATGGSAEDRRQLGPLKSLGVGLGLDDGDAVLLARAVIQ